MSCNASKKERLRLALSKHMGAICRVQMGQSPNGAFLHVFLSCKEDFATSLYNNNCTCCVTQVSKKERLRFVSKKERLQFAVTKHMGAICRVQMGQSPNGAFLHVFLSCKEDFATSLYNNNCTCCVTQVSKKERLRFVSKKERLQFAVSKHMGPRGGSKWGIPGCLSIL